MGRHPRKVHDPGLQFDEHQHVQATRRFTADLLSACDQAADYRRAEEWCRIVDDFARRQNFTPLFTICRAFYGGLLTAIGRWAEAEQTGRRGDRMILMRMDLDRYETQLISISRCAI